MSDAPDLAELERRATGHAPAYGEDAHIVCDNLVRIYRTEGVEVIALQGLDLLVGEGEMVALVGASGSGKSTLLNILAGLDVPTAGVARVAGADLLDMSGRDRLRFRRELVGFVWQQTARNLLPYLSAAENVEMPMRFAGRGRKDRRARAEYLLELMGVGHRAGARPGEMSGGEQQRAAIAVAVANQPKVVLADEPTGELDTATGEQVFGAGGDHGDRHARPGGGRQRRPYDRDPGRPDEQRDPAPYETRRGRPRRGDRRRVRRARPRRTAAVATRVHVRSGHEGPGAARTGDRSHRRLAGPEP
jgi:ABC-type lipoprotein export system ATPase subunit